MSNSKSIDALLSVHAQRRGKRVELLLAALERMAAGKTKVVASGFKWTRLSLARESGTHVNTLIRRQKGTGAFVYQEILDKLDSYASRRRTKTDESKKRSDALRVQLNEVARQRDRAVLALKGVEWELIKERELKLSAIRDKEALLERLNRLGCGQHS